MPLDLQIGPRRRSRRRLLWLVGAVLLLLGLVAWQRGWRPRQALAYLERDIIPPAVSQLQPGPISTTEPVLLVNSAVVESPQSQAHTARLYAAAEEDIPWPNVQGRTQVEIYTVQAGDTLWSIANRFGLDIDTLRWSNPELERNPDVLAVGTELRILPVIGAYHLVEAGDTIESIAAQYGVAEADITDYPPNALYPPYEFTPGQGLIIPYGQKDLAISQPALAADYPLAWPVAGYVTAEYQADHPALDIGAPYSSLVYAADRGVITYAGWAKDGYGYTVIIDHGDGRETWYNHLKGTLLEAGSPVSRGDPIAEVGSTGHSYGPHLHFEVHIDGEPVNPRRYLPTTP